MVYFGGLLASPSELGRKVGCTEPKKARRPRQISGREGGKVAHDTGDLVHLIGG